MTSRDDAGATMRKYLAERTGKSFVAWVNVARSLGTDRHSDIVTYLKTEGPMGHGYASAIALEARKSDVITDEDPVDLLFSGDKAALRPLYDMIAAVVAAFGSDVEFAARKNYVSLRRTRQFALVQPSTPTRVDIGINLKDVAPVGKLEASGTWNGMVSHRVRLITMADFNRDVKGWLKQAYDQAA